MEYLKTGVDLGKNLKAYRESAGYTQADFSSLCGISRQSLSKHESGRGVPSEENLTKYAKVLNISVEKLKEELHPLAWNFRVFTTINWSD